MSAKRGNALSKGDRLADREDHAGIVYGGLVEDIRLPTAEWPMSVAVKIGGEWQVLPAEGAFLVE